MKPKTVIQQLLFISIAQLAASNWQPATAQQPELVKDINPGAAGSRPHGFTEYNGKLFFGVDHDTHGKEPWFTDGTEAGTQMLKDIRPGSLDSNGNLFEFVVFDSKLFFSANDGSNGIELWVSDGTEAGTQLFKDLNPGQGGSYPRGFVVVGDKMIYAAYHESYGIELWVSDGTSVGTQLLRNIYPGEESGMDIGVDFDKYVHNGKLYFRADNGSDGIELWVSDGTTAGTQMLKDLNPGSDPSGPSRFTEYDGKLYFSAYHATSGRELWVTDGTTAGTQLVKDINPGPNTTGPAGFTEYNGKLYFGAEDGTHGRQLWVTDGTEAGTELAVNINPNGNGSPSSLTVYNGMLYFTANDAANNLMNYELWRTDGTTAGTALFLTLNPGASSVGSWPRDLFEYDGKLYFRANIGGDELFVDRDYQLFVTDGTETGTHIVAPDVAPSLSPVGTNLHTFVYDGSLYYNAAYHSDFGMELYKYTANNLDLTEHSGIDGFTFWPNPVSERLHLTAEETIDHAVLYNFAGQKVMEQNVSTTEARLSLNHLTPGLYILEVAVSGHTGTFKIMKK